MTEFIRISDGRVMSVSRADYDRWRRLQEWRSVVGAPTPVVKAVCKAPFVNLDFGPRGDVSLCNHIFKSVARISSERGVLEIWRGEEMRRLRTGFLNYCLDAACVHCIHQIETGHLRQVLAKRFDRFPPASETPPYPKRLIFRLNSTCNLACIMCDGETSSRVRKERDGLPPYPSAYGERFFRDMEEILPHVEYVEFYGGEPFLVAEHLRIMEMMLRLNCKAGIFVNTNAVAFNQNARRFIERLNFKQIVVSMDAFHSEVHQAVRIGLKHDQFMASLDWLMKIRSRRFKVSLNVTEHRKNWFDLPNLFRFADQNKLAVHINHCVSPANVTLYNLSEMELRYVHEFWQHEYDQMYSKHRWKVNKKNYEYMMSLVIGELGRRDSNWQPFANWSNLQSDGRLAVPVVGLPPFDSPQRVTAELARISRLHPGRALSMLRDFRCGIEAKSQRSERAADWADALEACSNAIAVISSGAESPAP
jgi:MoaA/NifB/PqqE/SkfB family radical SAM enzyme